MIVLIVCIVAKLCLVLMQLIMVMIRMRGMVMMMVVVILFIIWMRECLIGIVPNAHVHVGIIVRVVGVDVSRV